MQDFHPDCIINILVTARGQPAKFTWACGLFTRERVPLVIATRFLGHVPREEAEAAALLFGLEQAARLQQEKVQLGGDIAFPGINAPAGRGRKGTVPLKMREALALWESFRLRKSASLTEADRAALRGAFEPGARRIEGQGK